MRRRQNVPFKPVNLPSSESFNFETMKYYKHAIDGFVATEHISSNSQLNGTKAGDRKRFLTTQKNATFSKKNDAQTQSMEKELTHHAKQFISDISKKFPHGLAVDNTETAMDYFKEFITRTVTPFHYYLNVAYEWPKEMSAAEKNKCISDLCAGYLFAQNTICRQIMMENNSPKQMQAILEYSGEVINQRNKEENSGDFIEYISAINSKNMSHAIYQSLSSASPDLSTGKGIVFAALKGRELIKNNDMEGFEMLQKEISNATKSNKFELFQDLIKSERWAGVAVGVDKNKIPATIIKMQTILDNKSLTQAERMTKIEDIVNNTIQKMETKKNMLVPSLFNPSKYRDPLSERFYYLVAGKQHPGFPSDTLKIFQDDFKKAHEERSSLKSSPRPSSSSV